MKIRKIMLTPKQWKDLMSKLDEISNRVKVPICIDSPLEGLLKGKGYLNPCVCGYLYLGISSNGDAFPCPIMTDVKIGNIRKESIVEIWNSDVIKNLRDASQLKGACASCTYKMRCNGGCRALAYYIKGDYTCPDPFCWIASQKKC
jgi:radical SAM protein with 4Fe4S-binding SPASM domain